MSLRFDLYRRLPAGLRLRQHAAELQHSRPCLLAQFADQAADLFNLAQALTDPEFVPSQATISIGTAQTLNAVTPPSASPSACRS